MKRTWMAGWFGLLLIVASDGIARPTWTPEEGNVVKFESTVLESALFEEEAAVLVVTYRNGESYEYYGVSRNVFQGLLKAEDKGKYFNANIRNAYKFHRIEDRAAVIRP